MFANVLVANRGEIACRVVRTARRLGMRTIALATPADRGALHTRLADEAHEIGAGAEGYLDGEAIVALAKRVGAECVHPGYGFLSENADFAELCGKAGLVFVGPSPAAMRALGLKHAAKALMAKLRVPVAPGYYGDNQSPKFLKEKAYEIGYPVLIKAIAGGGGRGMRRVDAHVEFEAALEAAAREAEAAFGDARVLIEKYILAPRHVEVQVFGDARGGVVHLFERDCSLQRRHQKVIEESPAPGLPEATREAMCAAAVAAARAVGYVGAGTVEFILDASRGLGPDCFYFLEMNTRLQVEHPVTEQVTGLDLVKLQIAIAAGHRLPFAWEAITPRGHAMEVRLYAEDPDNNFFPSPGKILSRHAPTGPGIRLDEGVYEGYTVPLEYDPLLSKLIAWGNSREETIARLRRALDEYTITGIRTNVSLFRRILADPEFLRGEFHTKWLDELLARPSPPAAPPRPGTEEASVIAAALWHTVRAGSTANAAQTSSATPSRWKSQGRREQLDRTP